MAAADGKAAAAPAPGSGGVKRDTLIAAFKAAPLSASTVVVVDTSGDCGAKFEVVVVSSTFDGMPLLDRSRAVHAAVGKDTMALVHALSIKAWTPAQWEQKKSTLPADYKPE